MIGGRVPFGELYAIPSRNGVSVPKGDRSHGTQMINMGELFRFSRIGDSEMARVPLPESELAKSLVEPGDLLFARRSLQLSGAGRCSLVVPAREARTFESSIIRVRLNPERAVPEFYYYFFSSRPGREVMETIVEQAVVAGIRASDLQRLSVPAPPLSVQRGIANMLGVLDRKIESNRRAQNSTEQLLRCLVTDALIKSHCGEAVLGDYCTVTKSTARLEDLTPGDHYIGLEHMPRGSIFLDSWESAEGLGSNKSRFQTGDVLFGKLRPYFKKVGVAPIAGVCSTDILVLRPNRKEHTALVAIVASSEDLINSLSAAATGTRMPRASASDVLNWPTPKLHENAITQLAGVATPLLERGTALTHEIHHLADLRDALLPELILGRIRVSQADGEAGGMGA